MRLLPILILLGLVAVLVQMFFFILGRRVWRGRSLRRRDRYRLHWLRRLPDLLAGQIPTSGELRHVEARETLETLLTDRLQTGTGDNPELLSVVIERSGLLDRRIEVLRRGGRWERLHSAVLLGYMRAPAAVPALLEAMGSPWRPLRTAAVRSLGMIASPAAGPALLALVRDGLPVEPSIWLDAVVACIPELGAFLPLLSEGVPEIRALAARAIAQSPARPPFESLQRFAFDPDSEVRAQVLRALGRCADRRVVPLLIAAANDPVWFVRLRALAALADLGAAEAVGAVLCATRDPDFRVRQRAAATLSILATNPAAVLEILLRGSDRYALEGFLSELARAGLFWRALSLLRSPEAPLKRSARQLLTCAVNGGYFQEVLYAVEAHPEWRVRLAAARLLAGARNRALVPELEKKLAAASTERLRRILRCVLRALEHGPREELGALAHTV